MKKTLVSFIIITVLLCSISSNVSADKEDEYLGGSLTLYQTPMCILFGSNEACPTYNPVNGNNFYGYYCLNQYTDYTPVSGTKLTTWQYNNNNTQKYYRFVAAPAGVYTSIGYSPVSATELSINRRRILPSYVNMVETVGNNMVDFNIHPATCHGTVNDNINSTGYGSSEYGASYKLIALSFDGTPYPCGWTQIVYEPGTGTMGPFLLWIDGGNPPTNYNPATYGTCLYIFFCAGYRMNYCPCGKFIYWPANVFYPS